MSNIFGICTDCSGKLETDEGMLFCVSCGVFAAVAHDASHTSFDQTHSVLKHGYSRKKRFEKKLIASLRCHVNYNIDENLILFLQKQDVSTPEKMLNVMGKYPIKRGGRRPYLFICFYWKALGNALPIISERDIFCLKQDFDDIFFAWERLGFEPPMFPYGFLLKRIVSHRPTRYSNGMREMCRFVRDLRCAQRSARYEFLFQKCVEFIYSDI